MILSTGPLFFLAELWVTYWFFKPVGQTVAFWCNDKLNTTVVYCSLEDKYSFHPHFSSCTMMSEYHFMHQWIKQHLIWIYHSIKWQLHSLTSLFYEPWNSCGFKFLSWEVMDCCFEFLFWQANIQNVSNICFKLIYSIQYRMTESWGDQSRFMCM